MFLKKYLLILLVSFGLNLFSAKVNSPKRLYDLAFNSHIDYLSSIAQNLKTEQEFVDFRQQVDLLLRDYSGNEPAFKMFKELSNLSKKKVKKLVRKFLKQNHAICKNMEICCRNFINLIMLNMFVDIFDLIIIEDSLDKLNFDKITKILKILSSYSKDFISIQNILNSAIFDKEKPLHMALRLCDSALCKFLIENGAIADLKALHIAATFHEREICKLLLKSGVEIDDRDYFGRTLLMIAAQNKKLEMCHLLIFLGAQLDVYDNENHSVAWWTNDQLFYAINISGYYSLLEEMKKEEDGSSYYEIPYQDVMPELVDPQVMIDQSMQLFGEEIDLN